MRPLSNDIVVIGRKREAYENVLKNIEILEREKILEHVREVGPYFESQLATLTDCPLVGDVRGSHFMHCIENVANKRTRALFPDAVNIGKRISNACEERGLMVRPVGHLNVLSPPLILTRAQIDFIVATLRDAQEAVAAELVTAFVSSKSFVTSAFDLSVSLSAVSFGRAAFLASAALAACIGLSSALRRILKS